MLPIRFAHYAALLGLFCTNVIIHVTDARGQLNEPRNVSGEQRLNINHERVRTNIPA